MFRLCISPWNIYLSIKSQVWCLTEYDLILHFTRHDTSWLTNLTLQMKYIWCDRIRSKNFHCTIWIQYVGETIFTNKLGNLDWQIHTFYWICCLRHLFASYRTINNGVSRPFIGSQMLVGLRTWCNFSVVIIGDLIYEIWHLSGMNK